MNETILFPSPNWFLVSNLAVSEDGWLIYGGPSKSLCVLEPLDSNQIQNLVISGNQGYQAHVVNRAHSEKIVSVDISPEWSEKRSFLTGSADGLVKQWALEKVDKTLKIKSTHTHEIHHQEKEEVVGVEYSNEVYAITVGSYGNIVKWDLNSNVVKTYSSFLKNFKPVCMSCSRHTPLNVAVGTKQGVIFVIDLDGSGKIIYKVRGQDDEVMNISWCPQYEVEVKKTLNESEKRSFLTDRLNAIRNGLEPENLEVSGTVMNLPEDSFDEPIVVEDDMFDIYKDHEPNEFGHKKYEPEEILVKVKEDIPKDSDYLADCMKLKDDILKRKNQTESSIESLVDALDKTHVDGDAQSTSGTSSAKEPEKTVEVNQTSGHPHKHLLATIGKYGGVRIWSKSGKLVGSCAVPSIKNQRSKVPVWPTLLWYKPDVLIIADGKSQLLECNPLQIDCKNKLEWHIVHTCHKRGLYCVAAGARRVQPAARAPRHWPVWTVSQDRNMVRYDIENKKMLATLATCGGFLYTVQMCPYDAGMVAVSVGDGAVRVWQTMMPLSKKSNLTPGSVRSYWQNVQGKVLTVAWHPTIENLLAFATAENRVGIIETSGKSEKAARVLVPALSGAVYSLGWAGRALLACGGGHLVKYHTDKPDEAPERVAVVVEGETWRVAAVMWTQRGILCGSNSGGVALLAPEPPHNTLAVAFVFTKMIHSMQWHPLETTRSAVESPHKNIIAVCSLDKEHTIALLEYGEKDDRSKELCEWKRLAGHAAPVLQLAWSPHRDAYLLSTSQDATVRVWNAMEGVCVSIFAGHAQAALGAAWSPLPWLEDRVLSGGADCCLRLWSTDQHPAADYVETKHETITKKKKKNKRESKKSESETAEGGEQVAASLETKIKASKRFLFPITTKQLHPCSVHGLRKMLQMHLEKNSGAVGSEVPLADGDTNCDTDYIKMFGSINDVNQLLDKEMARHLEASNVENWIMLSIFRGHIDPMIQFANQRDLLCPYLVSIAPCVSFKYWKDVTQLYVAQIDRLVAKGEEEKLYENKMYGGPVYRKAATLLAAHDVKGAVAALAAATLYKEAYILCRTRYMDSIAEEILRKWVEHSQYSGLWNIAALCCIALGEFSQAASILSKSNNQESLSLAADLAKVAGQTTFADHVEKKAQIKQSQAAETTEQLEHLPSRIDLLMKENKETENGEASTENVPVSSSVSDGNVIE